MFFSLYDLLAPIQQLMDKQFVNPPINNQSIYQPTYLEAKVLKLVGKLFATRILTCPKFMQELIAGLVEMQWTWNWCILGWLLHFFNFVNSYHCIYLSSHEQDRIQHYNATSRFSIEQHINLLVPILYVHRESQSKPLVPQTTKYTRSCVQMIRFLDSVFVTVR